MLISMFRRFIRWEIQFVYACIGTLRLIEYFFSYVYRQFEKKVILKETCFKFSVLKCEGFCKLTCLWC